MIVSCSLTVDFRGREIGTDGCAVDILLLRLPGLFTHYLLLLLNILFVDHVNYMLLFVYIFDTAIIDIRWSAIQCNSMLCMMEGRSNFRSAHIVWFSDLTDLISH